MTELLSPRFDLPYPDSAEPADVPADLLQLVTRLEALIKGDDTAIGYIWDPGDFKDSARATDHGRWLLCDGRSLTQVEIEAALSLDAGEAAEFVTVMGVGNSSIYGDAAAVDEVQLPDFQGKFGLYQSSPGHPKKGAGSSGGAETVVLTEANLPPHAHSDGSLACASHSHSDGTLAAANHSHGDGTLTADNTNAEGTIARSGFFEALGGVAASIGGAGSYVVGHPAAGDQLRSYSPHTHTVSGSTDVAGADVTGSTGSTGADVTGATGNGAGTSDPVNKMPPFVVKGNCFIRV